MSRALLPEEDRRQRVNISLSDEAIEILDALAAGRGLSRSALIEQLAREETRRVTRRETKS